MIEYHKIEGLYKRDMEGNKQLIIGEFRNPVVEHLKDNEWVFTEKVDGTNVRIHWDGHKVSFAGRTDRAEFHKDLTSRLEELFLTNEVEELFEQQFADKEVILFGEGYGAGIQKGGGDYQDHKDFILFDVMVGTMFLQREDVEMIAKSFGLDVVPVFATGTIDEAIELVKDKPVSKIGKCLHEIEGVVGTPKVRIFDVFGNRIIVKIKVKDFASVSSVKKP